MGTLALAARLARRWPAAQRRASLLTMLATGGFFIGQTMLMTDPFLVLWFAAACVGLFEAYQPEIRPAAQRRWLLLAAAGAALGVMTKGLVAAVLPAGALFLWLLWERRLARLWNWSLLWAALLFLAIVAPWLWWLEQHNPGFAHSFIIDEHFSRFTGTRATQGHPEPFWFFLTLTPLMLLPWTLFILRAVRQGWRQHDSLTRFLLVWALLVVVFFSISSGKLMSYILPAFLPLGLLLGRWGVAEPLDGSAGDRRCWMAGVAGPLVVVVALGLFWAASYFQWVPRVPAIARISLLAFLPVAGALWHARRAWTTPAGVTLVQASLLLAVALWLSPLAGLDFNVFAHLNNSILYKQLAAQLQPEDQLVVFYDYRPALMFYAQRPYVSYQSKNELAFGMGAEPQRRGNVDTLEALREIVRPCRGRVFALIDPGDLKQKVKPLDRYFRPTAFPRTPDTVVVELKGMDN
ncbi:MAG: phospholipid carrier-dependent glycosyltransferase [Kiritimatiellaeota bacterium]|nr:phospholipid carrier-dependent glycosyltransferase [Kiritimatiellota bacterium]